MFLMAAFSNELPFTSALNGIIGPVVGRIMMALGVHPANAQRPIVNWVAMEILVALFLLVVFVILRATLSVDKPSGTQHMFEMLHSFVADQAHGIIGHEYKSFVPFLMTLGMFLLLCNLLGLIPGFISPTANPAVPLGCAVCTFLYYNGHGISRHKFGYLKHFAGPVWWLMPLMFVIEIVSHLARLLSLTVRLFANIFAGDMVTLAFFSLVPLGLPVIFMGLHMGVALIQTYIFILLAMVYLAGAVHEAH